MENTKDLLGLKSTKLNVNDIIESVISPNCGAVSTFIGTTRDNFNQKKVIKLEYEAYEPMAVKEMQSICYKIRSQWDVEKIAIYHRLGDVPVTEASIVIAISSPHRTESLKAVEYAIDTVKKSVPIWKKEVYEDDEPQWKENKECLWAKNSVKLKSEQNLIPDEVENNAISNVNNGTNDVKIDIDCVQETVEIKSEFSNDNSYQSTSDNGKNSSCDPDFSNCQLKRDVNEIFRRVESFVSSKKEVASVEKLQGNCAYSSQLKNDSDDSTNVCSRVNIIWTKHKHPGNRNETYRVYNQWNHQNIKPKIPIKSENKSNDYPPALEERLSVTEKMLGINKPVPPDVYQRIKKIEDRILCLERISPEYKNIWTNLISDNKTSDDEIDRQCDNFESKPIRKRNHSSGEVDSERFEFENRYGKRFR